MSSPKAIASAPTTTAPPSTRRIHSSAPSERFIAANTRPPSSSATASDSALPAAYASSNSEVWTLAPRSAAPVSIKPKMGPAHGAQSRPVATPSSSEDLGLPSAPAEVVSRLPSATNGRLSRSAKPGKSNASPNTSTSASAIHRPHWFACTTQPPPTAASVATTANVTAIPTSSGRPLRRNGWSARVNTNGSTGRMHGLRIVSTPPKNASTNSSIVFYRATRP